MPPWDRAPQTRRAYLGVRSLVNKKTSRQPGLSSVRWSAPPGRRLSLWKDSRKRTQWALVDLGLKEMDFGAAVVNNDFKSRSHFLSCGWLIETSDREERCTMIRCVGENSPVGHNVRVGTRAGKAGSRRRE